MTSNSHLHYDVLVIGSGAAGLSLALRVADQQSVGVFSKASITDGSTRYAQGGISAVLADEDSTEDHINDTLNAGAGLCNETAVRLAAEEGPECVQWLAELGVEFTKEGDHFHLTREGGHSFRRVIHVADETGLAVSRTLVQIAREHPAITCHEHHLAIDLIIDKQRCVGAYFIDLDSHEVMTVSANTVVLATGGANKVYLYSSNPHASTGDGIAMAWRAGCRVSNMEFMQFHPTCLYHTDDYSFLITEAVRGEGGLLKLPNKGGTPGERFMPRFDDRAELAPRDIVARAIDFEMKRLGIDHVLLDITHQTASFITTHFPGVYKRCKSLGLDMTKQALPVVPATHYTCGGVLTGLNGQTDIPNLYAIGETACTGLHGANRMASNSLLECLVFAKTAAEDILSQPPSPASTIDQPLPCWDASQVTDATENIIVSHNWDDLRRLMWNYVGIVRTQKRMQLAQTRLTLLRAEIEDHYRNHTISPDFIELRNLAQVAELILTSAIQRKESRGLHYTPDFPDTAATAEDTILHPEPTP